MSQRAMIAAKQVMRVVRTGLVLAALGSAFEAEAAADRFVYVGNDLSASISAYTISSNGALQVVVGSPFASGSGPLTVVMDPTGRYVFSSNRLSSTVSAFRVNSATGALTSVSGSPFAAGSGARGIAVDPFTRFLYTGNAFSNDVSAFTINDTTGALSVVPGSPFAAGSAPSKVIVDPSGRFLYVTNLGGSSVSSYTIDQTSGALTAIGGSPFTVGFTPVGVTVDPAGKFLYVGLRDPGAVAVFAINATTGALSAVAGSPFLAGTTTLSVTLDPSGRFLYAANADSNNVSAYAVNAQTGALTALAGSPFAAGLGARAVGIDASGAFAYVANSDANTVTGFSINSATGALTQVPGAPSPAGSAPSSVATLPSVLPRVSIDDRSVCEGSAVNAAFRVALSKPTTRQVALDWRTADGTAAAPSDYTSISGTLIISPGRTEHSIFVPIVSDTTSEPDETFFVDLTVLSGARFDSLRATGSIANPPAPVHAAMYRAYNKSTDYHFFTTDLNSKNFAVGTLGFQDESNPVPFYVWNVMQSGTTALFRMYNPNLGRHFYTASSSSRDFIMSIGGVYEKEEGFVYPLSTSPVPSGATELFLLYNNNSGTHLFTADANQKNGILNMFPGVWVQHTSVGYVFTSP